jgi:piezo-type mechanosensitive ion channel component 1/2
MIVLLLIYVFQFDEVPAFFKRILNINDLTLSAIGFEKFEKKDELFLGLLTPTTFLIVNILQIHYFNKEWLELTDNSGEYVYYCLFI